MSRELKEYDLEVGGRKASTILEKRKWFNYHGLPHKEFAVFFWESIHTNPKAETSLIIPWVVGLPNIFEVEELRLYPGSADKDSVKRWLDCNFQATLSPTLDQVSLEKKEHLPIPLVDDDGIGRDYNKDFSGLRELVNGNKLPALSASIERRYEGSDAISVCASIKNASKPMKTYAVLLGSLWIPSQEALQKATARR